MSSYDHLIKSNLHTHTSFCDGADSPEEMVKTAIALGMETIGFSGHAYTSFDLSYCMSLDAMEAYRQEVDRVRKLYGDRIHILCGLERDFYAEYPERPFEYEIGSVHYVLLDGEYCEIDSKPNQIPDTVREHCSGNFYKYSREYYRTVASFADRVDKCDIIGHFDLITKYNEDGHMFDVEDPRYRRPAFEALDALLEKGMLFEVNTGAIARGYRTKPYPELSMLRYIAERGGRVTLNSDCHKKENLLCAFPFTLQMLKYAGFRSVYSMTRTGWKEYPL
ncbi:MAG: histidinol-phosphatase HisJ family protein [Ruminococcaceae bacterium]|nr:histidinol-phosphatase HisJ family protein [Oscillospiraceae bacterium]